LGSRKKLSINRYRRYVMLSSIETVLFNMVER